MRSNRVILALVFTFAIILASCNSFKNVQGDVNFDQYPTTSHKIEKFDPDYDLGNNNFYDKFTKYFDMDRDSLLQTLEQDFSEVPKEGMDEMTNEKWIRLNKMGLQFFLTDEEEVPVSYVNIDHTSPVHFGGTQGMMNFRDIMNEIGETMILAQEEDGQMLYSIRYPIDGVSVIFQTNNVFENSAKMMVSTWGYYDEMPTKLSSKDIKTYYGTLRIPNSWEGNVAVMNNGDRQTVLYLGHDESFPLVEIITMDKQEWNSMNQKEQTKLLVADHQENWVLAIKKLNHEPRNQQELKQYHDMNMEVNELVKNFELIKTEDTDDVEINDYSLGAAPADSYSSEMLLRAYEEAIIDSLNNADFSLVEKYLVKDSEIYKELKHSVSEKSTGSVSYTLISFEIEDIVEQGDVYIFHVKETVEINDQNHSEPFQRTDYWMYTVISNEDNEGIINKVMLKKDQ